MTTSIEQFIVDHIADKRGISHAEIERDADVFERGYVDSLGVFNMMMALEDAFDVRFGEDDLVDPAIHTIVGLAALIDRKRQH